MKPFFLSCVLFVSCFGCAQHPPVAESTPCYSKEEVDARIDSLTDEMRVLKNTLAETQTVTFDNANRFSEYRKNITATAIPESVMFCGTRIPLDRPDVRERFEKQLYLTVENQAQLLLYLLRKEQFFPIIESSLANDSLPDDLKYIAVIESALKSSATSRAQAQGFWQFMAGTARSNGLKHNEFIDMRNNLEASTKAAAVYFRKLHNEFDDWMLALAAYNMGEGGLRSRIKEQGSRDYFRLWLPDETMQYVFRAAAVKLILEDPVNYGIAPETIRYWDEHNVDTVSIRVKNLLTVQMVAEWCGCTYYDIRILNPELRKDVWPQGNWVINVPNGTRDRFYEGLAKIRHNKTEN